MTLSLGRIEPGQDPDVGWREADVPSRQLLRELHDDLVRRKRLGFLKAAPLLILAAFAVAAAIADFRAFGGLLMFAVVTSLAVGQIGYEWLTLRRADPLALYERAQREAEQRVVDRYEHAVR